MKVTCRTLALALGIALALPAAMAQPAPGAPAVSPQLAQDCSGLSSGADDARSLALRSQCVLVGAIPSEGRYVEARELARKSLAAGDPAGAFMLYVVYSSDPANGYLRDGKVDMDAHRRLAAKPVAERADHIEALDALAFAATKGHVNAGVALATYFYETAAPRNIERVRGIASLYLRNGENSPVLRRLLQNAMQVLNFGPTKASLRAFIDAYGSASGAAAFSYAQRHGGQTCTKFTPKVLESTDIEGAEYLPLTHKALVGTYLMRGQWVERWNLAGCGEEIPITVNFEADGWGGARFTASATKS